MPHYINGENPLLKFTFTELVEMIKTISRTKNKSRQDKIHGGVGLQSMEHLESHIDDFLFELAQRIKKSWSQIRIQRSFRYSKLNLPTELLNAYNITPAQLSFMIYKDKNSIGAIITDDGKEEIYIKNGMVKYLMKTDGNIVILNN